MWLKQPIDAPIIPFLFCVGGIIILAFGFIPPIRLQSTLINLIVGIWFIACGTIFLRTSLKGKAAIWNQLLSTASINPDGQYLDIGTGNGLVMFKLAPYLKTGSVTGIDIWNSRDQSHNSEQTVTNNIKEHSLEDVVKVQTANMCDLPFEDQSFDGVTASFAIHNVKPVSNREKALTEIARVLKPNGQLMIVDMEYKDREYVKFLEASGFKNIKVKKAGFNGWWSGPWAPSFVITATR